MDAPPEGRQAREIVEAILRVLRAGCAWRLLPMDFPRGRRSAPIRRWGERPSGRAYTEPSSWPAGNGQAGKPLRPRRSSTAGPSGRPVERKFKGHEAGKPIRGRKRRILTEAGGRLRAVEVRDADLHQDRDGAKGVLKRSRRRFPFVARLGRRRPPPASRFPGLRRPLSSSIIPRRLAGTKGLVVIRRRRVVERALARIPKRRRLGRAQEQRPRAAGTLIAAAAGRPRRAMARAFSDAVWKTSRNPRPEEVRGGFTYLSGR